MPTKIAPRVLARVHCEFIEMPLLRLSNTNDARLGPATIQLAYGEEELSGHVRGKLSAKKGAPTTAAPETPAKAHTEQRMTDAPLRGRGSSRCFRMKEAFRLQFGGFSGSRYLTLARQFKM